MTGEFSKGMSLCRSYYFEIVRKIIKSEFPKLQFSAGLIDSGSEVLGFDTPVSRDHDWGPRVTVFVCNEDYSNVERALFKVLTVQIPKSYHNYPTSFTKQGGEVIKLRVEIITPKRFFANYLAYDISKKPTHIDWLLFSEQKLRTIRHGEIFEDMAGLETIRNQLRFYPKDIWFYLMACDWQKIGQEEPFIGRCGEVSDELGSAVIAARLVKILMHLCFMLEKEYAPYSKWYGTAFSLLKCAPKLTPVFKKIIASLNWKSREKYLVEAFENLAQMHNNLGITEPLPEKADNFYSRGYKVINGGVFAGSLMKQIEDYTINQLNYSGSINQITSSCDILENNMIIKKLKNIYC